MNAKLGFIWKVAVFLPLGYFLYLVVFCIPHIDTETKLTVVRLIFSGAVGLSSLLLAIIGALIAIYWSAKDPVKNQLRPLIWWVVGILALSSIAALMALCYNLFEVDYLFTFIVGCMGSAIYMVAGAMIIIVAEVVCR